MRCLYLLFLTFGISSSAFGQDSTHTFAGTFDFFHGQKFLWHNALNDEVSDLNDLRFGEPLSYVGVGGTGLLVVGSTSSYDGGYAHPGRFSYYHLIPQEITINDTISGRVSGFDFAMTLAGWDAFRRTRWVDLVFGAGLKTGRIRLFGHSSLEQVNAYFSPFVSISPRFNFGRLSFQFNAQFELDITRSKWRKVWFSTSPKVDLGPMRSTGLSTSLIVGWVIN